jgi:propionyl-CoA carboxylase alpha chain
VLIAVVMEAQARRRAEARVLATLPSGWRNSSMPPQRSSFAVGGEEIEVSYAGERDGSFAVTIGDADYRVVVRNAGSGSVAVDADGRRVGAEVDRRDDLWFVHTAEGDVTVRELPRFVLPGADEFQGGLTAPMPGKVLATHVEAGVVVEKGQLLLILEAMKMEHRITAPVAGTVTAVHAGVGDQVANGELLIVLEEAGA